MTMNSIIVPAKYDVATAQGWAYHRNGVAGWGFWAKLTETALLIAFDAECDPDGRSQPSPLSVSIPLAVLQRFYSDPLSTGRQSVRDGRYLFTVALGAQVVSRDETHLHDRRFLMVQDAEADPRDFLCATFDLGLLLEEGDYGQNGNCWRGDHFALALEGTTSLSLSRGWQRRLATAV